VLVAHHLAAAAAAAAAEEDKQCSEMMWCDGKTPGAGGTKDTEGNGCHSSARLQCNKQANYTTLSKREHLQAGNHTETT
jgi:hypothetical protein